MTTPEQLLADARWRLRHSIYTLWALFGFGFISLLYTGVRARRNQWLVWGAVYGVIAIGALIIGESLAPEDPDATTVGEDLAFGTWVFVWAVSAIQVFWARREWLRWKAAQAGGAAWYQASPTAGPTSGASVDLSGIGLDDPTAQYLSSPAPAVAATASPPQPPATTSQPLPPPPTTHPGASDGAFQPSAPPPTGGTATGAPGELVDLNTATLDTIASLPGVGVATAHRIVEERERRGGFKSVDEAAEAANLQPHLRSRLQQRAEVSERGEPPLHGPAGRVVDI